MGTENKYLYTKAYFKIRDLILNNPNENVFVIRGGQGAGKTVSILQLIIQSLCKSPKEATVLSSELSKMKKTVIRDYKKIVKDWGLISAASEFNKSESKHEYSNASYIDFLGADVNDVGKGFRRDILYINEADKMDIETAVQFISRAGLTIIDYNPDSLFWGDDYINGNNFITLTFKDNQFLSESEVKSILEYREKGFFNIDLPLEHLFEDGNIKSNYWANKWRVYGLGQLGQLDSVIFNNWKQIDSIPKEARLLGHGIDFGYTNDPTTVISLYKLDKDFILHEALYQKGMSNRDIFNSVKSLGSYFIADSAEPKSIAELQSYGLAVMGAEKGAGSVMHGIQSLQSVDLMITSSSVNLIKELRNYTWDKDRNGTLLQKPIDAYNHGIDAARYIAQKHIIHGNIGHYDFR